MTIRPAYKEDISVIRKLAQETWWPTYQSILSGEQISLMLEKMYSEEALTEQMGQGQQFALAESDGSALAFCSFSGTTGESIVKIHKLYVHPRAQGLGAGKQMINYMEERSRALGASLLELNVNRHNPALAFYKRIGFDIYQEVDIPYYQFFMNDYIMRRPIAGGPEEELH
ncbi:N-acetyltransferase family protein [Arcticibacter sp. MXS-1]|uniref:GNAT family N-acetyltransferase n=1 Tax=Arcticibacter sp. MXS-1 TaxID=3341726 RepID=UPI0035A9128B